MPSKQFHLHTVNLYCFTPLLDHLTQSSYPEHDMSTQKYRRWSEFYRPRGACLAATGGCPYPTGWLGHPNHLQLPR
jgi:hypothetical protein